MQHKYRWKKFQININTNNFLAMLRACVVIGMVPYEALDRMMENPDLVTLLGPLMAYDMEAGHKTRWIESTIDYTSQVLYRCGFQ